MRYAEDWSGLNLTFLKIMKRYCLALDLKQDEELIRAYEKWHKPEYFRPEILKSIRDAGITAMDIFRTGNRLFMIMETEDDFDFDKKAKMDATDPNVQDWEQFVWNFQQPLPWAAPGEKWVLMEQIFGL